MNFYAFHIGDYASATRHLTWDEDAAYRRLLDAYYVREAPLPLEARQVYRLVAASTDEQRTAVDTVLDEFFTKTESGWSHPRCDAELAKVKEKKAKAAESANKRWGNANAQPAQCEGNANASETVCEGNAPIPNPIPNKNINTSPQAATRPSKGRTKKTPLPDGFTASSRVLAWMAEKGYGHIDRHVENFVSYVRSNGKTYADWDEALMRAIRDDWAKVGAVNGKPADDWRAGMK